MRIRTPHAGDAAALAGLLKEQGIEVPVATLAQRIRDTVADPGQRLLLAGDESPLGLIQAFRAQRITRGAFIEIGFLAVLATERRQGIARALVAEIRAWAQEAGLPLRVRCNASREEAHAFYAALGFAREKDQRVYILG